MKFRTKFPMEIYIQLIFQKIMIPDIDPISNEPEENEGRIVFTDNQPPMIRCGTLNKLIIYLTSPQFQDMNYTRSIVTTYRSFTTPTLFIRKLIDRFNQPTSSINNGNGNNDEYTIRLRVISVLRQWIETQFADLTPPLFQSIRNFINDDLITNPQFLKVGGQMLTFIDKVLFISSFYSI